MMTVGHFISVEVVLKKSVESFLGQMSNANSYYDEECDWEIPCYEEFENNFQNGLMAILGMCAYVEYSFNSLIRVAVEVFPYSGPDGAKYIVPVENIENALKPKMKDKAKWIVDNGIATDDFKENRFWQDFLNLANLRNHLLHFNGIGCKMQR